MEHDKTVERFQTPYAEQTEKIIGAAMRVLNELKPGLDAKLYENALVVELQGSGHQTDQQRAFSVCYRGRMIGR